MTSNKLLTAEEVAQKLQISKGEVYRLAKRKDFPTIRWGKKIRVREADLDDWLDRYRACIVDREE